MRSHNLCLSILIVFICTIIISFSFTFAPTTQQRSNLNSFKRISAPKYNHFSVDKTVSIDFHPSSNLFARKRRGPPSTNTNSGPKKKVKDDVIQVDNKDYIKLVKICHQSNPVT